MIADKKKVVRLLRTARGQIEGILRMIDEDRYCIDVSNQIMASQAILSAANREVLKAHIKSCVLEATGTEEEEKLDEVCRLLDKLL